MKLQEALARAGTRGQVPSTGQRETLASGQRAVGSDPHPRVFGTG